MPEKREPNQFQKLVLQDLDAILKDECSKIREDEYGAHGSAEDYHAAVKDQEREVASRYASARET